VLHLRERYPADECGRIVDMVDRQHHGFEPSGVDSGYYLRGRGGLYCHGNWIDVRAQPLSWRCALVHKEKALCLPEVRELVAKRSRQLVYLAEEMTNALRDGQDLPLRPLFDYAVELFELPIYSAAASGLIGRALDHGVIAKGIGGLYDKAVLFLTTTENSAAVERIREEVVRVQGASWLSSA